MTREDPEGPNRIDFDYANPLIAALQSHLGAEPNWLTARLEIANALRRIRLDLAAFVRSQEREIVGAYQSYRSIADAVERVAVRIEEGKFPLTAAP